MSLDSEYIKKLEKFLISSGYTKIDRGLVVFGGKDNGTVDLIATNQDINESIIIEIKNNPIDLLDLSHYIILKRNIENHKSKDEKMIFFILDCTSKTGNEIKKIAKEKEIFIENLDDFLNRKKF